MFLKKIQLEKTSKTIPLLFKRTYNIKKLDLQAVKNPQVRAVHEKELQRRQQQGIFKRLVEKRYSLFFRIMLESIAKFRLFRTGDYNEYFSQSVSVLFF